ncbi:hypothetical protein SAMD00019534_001450 [Acytostelium subglobosum LB1]|uniref:hypothetical protein n=1 Tax=Acytostelium subglobosum LB1 TaxID=1410327 RepID=UPI0006451FDC|nr:hypothetical protein SAMD00019534_001450 [Acytostelium subglobosum LB1]GAM16970.1 hypothetical protein SAMD00019534_001450 [Acytostelium subglobosum LB1]|eukprot:XP_012759032.1 hypothetical protein SAMD00019534_001450 [Acytostelium subglobosum LB1]
MGFQSMKERSSSNIPSLLLSGSKDTTVKLWNLRHGNVQANDILLTYTEHTGPITACKLINLPLSSTPSIVASACENGRICIWSASTGETLWSTFVGTPVKSIDANEHMIIASDQSNGLHFWRITLDATDQLHFTLIPNSFKRMPFPNTAILSLHLIETIPIDEEEVHCQSYNVRKDPERSMSKHRRLKDPVPVRVELEDTLVGDTREDITYREQSACDLEIRVRLMMRSKSSVTECENVLIQDLCLVSEATGRALCGEGSPLQWYNCEDKGETLSVATTLSDDRCDPVQALVVASSNNTAKLFDKPSIGLGWQQRSNISTLHGHCGRVTSVHCDLQKIITTSSDTTIKIWSRSTCQLERTLTEHKDAVLSSRLLGPLLATGSNDSTIHLYNFNYFSDDLKVNDSE